MAWPKLVSAGGGVHEDGEWAGAVAVDSVFLEHGLELHSGEAAGDGDVEGSQSLMISMNYTRVERLWVSASYRGVFPALLAA